MLSRTLPTSRSLGKNTSFCSCRYTKPKGLSLMLCAAKNSLKWLAKSGPGVASSSDELNWKGASCSFYII